MPNKKIATIIVMYHVFMNVLHKYRHVMVVIWIIALITLGVIQYHVSTRIDFERSEGGRPSVPRPVR